MMKRTLLAACFCLTALSALHVQAEPATRPTVEQFLKVTEARQMLELAYQQMDQLTQQAGAGQPADTLQTKHRQQVQDLVKAELSWEQLQEPMIALYGTVFSEAELQDIIQFYQSAAGQKLLKRQPELMQNTMQLMQQRMQALQPKLQALIKQQQAERTASSKSGASSE
jgi:hypothetical protein